MLTLENRTALILGTKRVGAVVARRLAREGVRLALSYRGSRRAAQALQAELEPLVPTCLIQADGSRRGDVARLMKSVREELVDWIMSRSEGDT
jgi:NAD(P)-dependent dehydrogenase (short-subunit alcohol dehydrogenase family)